MNWNEMVEHYGGVVGVADMVDQEGIAYFVADYIGADAFKGGPLEEAAQKIEQGVEEFRSFFYG